MHRPVVAAGLVAVLAVPISTAIAGLPPTLPPESLVRGQRAVVRTVFTGAEVDSFEAEIVGVMPGGRTEGTLILARATTDRVQRSGVAQGMSGSPVFVDGRLVGALSSAFAFSREPLFGITPIGEMLELWDHAADPPGESSVGPSGVEPPVATSSLGFRQMSWAGEAPPAIDPGLGVAPSATPLPGTPARLPLPLSCGGLHPALTDIATRWFTPLGMTVVPGGRASTAAASNAGLEPGSAAAVELMRGDLHFAAIGTVTWRDGDRVLLFGHPFFQAGDVRMPLATAEIATIVASQQLSFKLGQSGREVGAVLQDRRAGIAGRLGARARMLPVQVSVSGVTDRTQQFRFESIEDRLIAPIVIGLAGVNSLLESGGTGASQTLRWTLSLHRRGTPPLRLTDMVASESPSADVAGALAAPLRFLFGNPFERLALDSIDVSIAAEPGRRAWTLRSARVVDATVRPGGTVRVACKVEPWRGPQQTRVVTLSVPEEVPDGRYALWVGGGQELTRFEASRLPGRYRATSLDDAWQRLNATRSSDALYAALSARAPEVSDDGIDYPELPASVLSVMTGDRGAPDRNRRGDLAWLDERRVPMDGVLRGELVLNVTVESRGTLSQPSQP